ncbi:MAG: YegS/Rv2252/BmrU family lipid kinase [Opitutaceae bacterium]|nr:YegS/Rv2252/BmrU family lipid kinase [Cytophagales bacterium]
MQLNHIHFILNPASGQDEPILSYINDVFKDSNIKWDVSVTKASGDAQKFAHEQIGKTDMIAVYGGDGSVSEVSAAMINSQTPLAIIAGGTANVMAKELGMPIDTLEALKLLRDGNFSVKTIDMGLANEVPFILRVNFGILADMVSNTDRELKNSLGQLAYGVSTIQTINKAEAIIYKLIIDGVEFHEKGVALTVTNSGNIGVKDFSILPDISVSDGFLDVILLNNVDLLSLMKVAGTTLFQTGSDVLKHWKCKEITISTEKPVSWICDDCEQNHNIIHIKTVPSALHVVVPDHFLNS